MFAEDRYLKFLCTLYNLSDEYLNIQVNQMELAQLIGYSRSTVNACFAVLKRRNLIDSGYLSGWRITDKGLDILKNASIMCKSIGEPLRDNLGNAVEIKDIKKKKLFCVKCGGKLESDWAFCPTCGEKNYLNKPTDFIYSYFFRHLLSSCSKMPDAKMDDLNFSYLNFEDFRNKNKKEIKEIEKELFGDDFIDSASVFSDKPSEDDSDDLEDTDFIGNPKLNKIELLSNIPCYFTELNFMYEKQKDFVYNSDKELDKRISNSCIKGLVYEKDGKIGYNNKMYHKITLEDGTLIGFMNGHIKKYRNYYILDSRLSDDCFYAMYRIDVDENKELKTPIFLGPITMDIDSLRVKDGYAYWKYKLNYFVDEVYWYKTNIFTGESVEISEKDYIKETTEVFFKNYTYKTYYALQDIYYEDKHEMKKIQKEIDKYEEIQKKSKLVDCDEEHRWKMFYGDSYVVLEDETQIGFIPGYFKNDKGEEEEGYRLYKINPDGSVYDYNIGVCGGIEYMYVFNGKIYCTDSVTQKKIEIDI